jgi:aspartyl aminopeptidase
MTTATDLLAFIDASPSPFHACETSAARLTRAGFVEVRETESWDASATRAFVRRGGSLVAWDAPPELAPDAPIRMVGAHTDSPNLRVKPRPDIGRAGTRQIAVEVYGGVLLNSWLDRDLGLSGRVVVDDDGTTRERLLRVDRPLLRIPQLAIHLDREIYTTGLLLNPQQHVVPLWGLGASDEGGFVHFLATELGVDANQILSWEVMTHDLTPSAVVGVDDELLSAPRLDNLCSCWAATDALVAPATDGATNVRVISLFDHEEVGSASDRGAGSSMLPTVLERIVRARGGDRDSYQRALAGSACASADMAHATHPNYPERHDPGHTIALGGGPTLKTNVNLRYASDATSIALLELAARQAGAPFQRFVSRNDMPCGSTIGPITAARLGVPTVDVGAPMLAMHSARELGAVADVAPYRDLLAAFLSPR